MGVAGDNSQFCFLDEATFFGFCDFISNDNSLEDENSSFDRKISMFQSQGW